MAMPWSGRMLARAVARWLDLGGAKRAKRRPLRPCLEELERRELPSSTPFLVADINPGSAGSFPASYTNVNGVAYFTAFDPNHGNELWKTNGTSSGTALVADINPGSASSGSFDLTNVNGTLFFAANDGSTGEELWKSDGTSTALVKDIFPGSTGSNPSGLTNVNGTLFFTANDGSSGLELWQSDGTASGTAFVSDINPGSASSNPFDLTNVNGTLFFGANDGSTGYELWKSDGTSTGTALVTDIHPGSANSLGNHFFYPNYADLTNINGALFFVANDGSSGFELWRSDGTSTGTALVKDIHPGSAGSYPFELTNVNGIAFFGANDGSHGIELWKSDGFSGGTVLVKDINPGSANSLINPADISFKIDPSLTNVNGTLFFNANDGSHGYELWKSGGTHGSTQLVRDINPGAANGLTSPNLTNVNGAAFFVANNGSSGNELWKSNGTASGTFLVRDINPGSASSMPNAYGPSSDLTNINGALFFAANDGVSGTEPWTLSGTPSPPAPPPPPPPAATTTTTATTTVSTGELFQVFFYGYAVAYGQAIGDNSLTLLGLAGYLGSIQGLPPDQQAQLQVAFLEGAFFTLAFISTNGSF